MSSHDPGRDEARQVPAAARPAVAEQGTAAGEPRPWYKRLGNVQLTLFPFLISATLWLVSLTLRTRFVHGDELFGRWERGEQTIVAFWHHRLLLMPVANRSRKLCILNSQSRDGEIATRALLRWGIRSVRGSATRGGVAGFLQLVRAFRNGYDLAVVPDGPRGPSCEAKPGVIHLARATGAPIVPVSWGAARDRRLRTWDRLVIPLPFTRVVYLAGEPLQVPRHATDTDVEACRRELEARLNAATERAERLARGSASA